MQRLTIIVVAALFSIMASHGNITNDRDTHIWIQTQDSAREIYFYDISNCVPRPNTYCSYWTTTDFGVHTMSDSLFQELITAGLFTGHDFNRRYLH